jgi:Ca2+-binding RTX toxin-like protein
MARAREAGVPPLNEVRREINAKTHDASLAPYTSWADFGQHMKHPQSLVNFVAAYATYPTIRDSGPDGIPGNGDDVTTVAAKRAAARAIVDPQPGDVQPCDANAFMFGTDGFDATTCPTGQDWRNDANGVTTTGLDKVDLWVGGLAEVTNEFGGMLGSTFNYVFQTQLEKLQDNDRFYYLNRTPGMNLRTQLEGNSFAEMIMRNSDDTNALKADVFATADCKFQLGDLAGTPAGFAANGPVVADDPATDCNETDLLLRMPDGTIQYKARNTVDPSGINGQSVYYGTDGVDRVFGGNDNDTFWGGNGADHIEGNGGDDIAFGGNGDDIITDLDGADVLEGGPGNDAIDAGPGDDLTIGNEGQDFITNGLNDNETFAGEGNDFIESGAGADAPFGDGGDDWMEGGTGQDILAGDHEAPFFDDPGELNPGNDIFIGQPGENDYDAEGGDDIMEQNAAIDRNAGAAGFDWAIHQTDTKPADDDMMINNNLLGLALQVVVNRDRWQETEADSGSDDFSDVIKGTDLERIVGPAGFSGCDALDQRGVDRIAGLNHYVTTFPTKLADVIAASAMKRCPLLGSGPTADGVWAEGDILMGGGKSDNLTGRSNDDIIDGDHSLNVYISVRQGVDANGNPSGPEIARTDLMEDPAISGSFGPGATPNMTLEQAVFSQLVDPGQLQAVREIHDIPTPGAAEGALLDPNANVTPNTNRASTCSAADLGITNADVPSTTSNCDIAEYRTGPQTFTVTNNPDGSTTVSDPVSVAAVAAAPGIPTAKGDGVDTLWNIEALRFCIANDPDTKACTQWQTFAINDPAIAGAGGPANAVALGGSPVSFGSLAVGTGPAPKAINIRNAGGGFLTAGTATLTGANAADFTILGDGCDTLVLGGGGTCTVDVGFAPATAGAKTATLTVPTDAGNVTVTLTGTATAAPTAAQASIAKPASFGTRRIGDPLVARAVAVRNDGNANLAISSATSSKPDFTVDLGTCNVPLAPTKTCKLNVTFVAALPIGPKVATLTVVSNASNSPTTVSLTGASKEAAVVVGALRIVQPATRATTKPVNVSLHISTAASIRLQVRKTSGKLVWSKRISARRAGTARLRWNLRDSKGHRVKKGRYIFTITVTDNTGAKVTVKRTVRVR